LRRDETYPKRSLRSRRKTAERTHSIALPCSASPKKAKCDCSGAAEKRQF
jgi:hypothetical protein